MLLLFPLVIVSLAMLFAIPPYLHVFQLESYKRPQFFLRLSQDASARKRIVRMWAWSLPFQLAVLAAVPLLFALLPALSAAGGAWRAAGQAVVLAEYHVCALAFLAAMAVHFRAWKKQPKKKPLNYTARVVRLVCAYILTLAAPLLVYYVLTGAASAILGAAGVGAAWATVVFGLLLVSYQLLLVVLISRLLALASLLVQPAENAVKNRYFNDARRKLAGFNDMVRIGITGSYGKTSAKVILATILSEKYKTYATPHSYNTPMGVTRAIREHLDGSYGVFVAEMGARHPGDIAEMCRLVNPRYGLLTSVGPQHLETFHTIENVARTKYELVEALPQDGMAFFPCDGGVCLDLYRRTGKPKALFGLEDCGEPLYMSAREIAHGPRGSSFALIGPGGESARCTTRLLGRHNVQNILGCAAVARALGLTMEEIARGISRIEPVEHRLQLIPAGNGVTVIDDAFNSNPAGARAALEVLRDFPGRKIVVTPGLVELGEAEEAENEAFGRAMAGAVDIAILVARNAPAMRKGLLEAGFAEGNLIVTGKLAEATAALGRLTRPGDVVLFENDLPDHYEI